MEYIEIGQHQVLSSWIIELLTILLATIGVQQYLVLIVGFDEVLAMVAAVTTLISVLMARIPPSYWMFGGVR